MNKFTVSLKRDGVWQPINATPVFPFSWGELLDERLDEAYITVYDSTEKTYRRLTDVKVTITNGSRVKEEYFIIASDNSYELPVGSGKYKHEIYLIERTKLLEGIYCSSITFTNAIGADFVNTNAKAVPQTRDIGLGGWDVPDGFVADFNPYQLAGSVVLPTPSQLADEMLPFVKEDAGSGYEVSEDYIIGSTIFNRTSAEVNGVTYGFNDPVTPNVEGSFIADYLLCYHDDNLTGGSYIRYPLRFYCAAVKNRLPLKRWSITDCIARACELAEPLFQGEKPKYRLEGVEYDENGKVIKPYTKGSLAEKYDKVFAPEFTATEDTLREQLKLILSYVHAEPWLDENDVIKVTEYGGTKNSAAASLPYVYNAVSSHINEYCTEIRSHAQNLVSSLGYARGVITDPGNGLYRSVRSDTAYVRINEGNAMAITNAPIYSIEKVYCGIATQDGTGWQLAPVEITPYVFEETEYSANLSSYAGGYPYSKQYAIYYTQGSPNLKGLFFKAPDAIDSANFSQFAISNILSLKTGKTAKNIDKLLTDAVGGAASLVFSISYKPISNHFVSHGKQLYVEGETPYMQLYNQSENLVESQYYGENLRGVAARLGNIEKERTFIIKNINDVPRVGEILDGYAISAVSCELYPFDIKCTVGLTKDFNRISEYVGINSQKRMYEISERAAVDRTLLIKETLVIGERPDDYNGDNQIFGELSPFYNAFDSDAANDNYKVSVARFQGKTSSGDPVTNNEVCLPVIARALGNIVTLNFSMKDNYSAGTKTQLITKADNASADVQGRWEQDVPYSDYYGRAWFADVWFYSGDLSTGRTPEELANFAYETPSESDILPPRKAYVRIDDHILRKDNRERISYNVELDIKTSREDIIIGSALADLCGWVNDTAVAPVMYYFDTSKYSVGKFDKIYTPHNDDIYAGSFASVAPDASAWKVARNGDGSLTLTVNPRGTDCGWVICTPITTRDEQVEDENGNPETVTYTEGGEILLASNTVIKSDLSLDFYVVKN